MGLLEWSSSNSSQSDDTITSITSLGFLHQELIEGMLRRAFRSHLIAYDRCFVCTSHRCNDQTSRTFRVSELSLEIQNPTRVGILDNRPCHSNFRFLNSCAIENNNWLWSPVRLNVVKRINISTKAGGAGAL